LETQTPSLVAASTIAASAIAPFPLGPGMPPRTLVRLSDVVVQDNGRGRGELALDLVHPLEVELEQPAQEPGHEQQVLAPVGQELGALLAQVEPGGADRRRPPEA
jgi:hypothetical protein